MEYPRVAGVITTQGNDISALCNAKADAYHCPPRLLVAQAIAESGLDETAARVAAWPDVSYGLWQQTVKFAPIGDHSASAQNIAYVRQVLTTNLTLAVDIAAKQLGAKWGETQDGPAAMGKYNAPSLELRENPNRVHILKSWAQSARYVVTEDSSMAGFSGGFADLADQLGVDVVGEALADEYQSGPTTRQPTTKGEMIWTDGGPALFLPGVTA